VVEAGLCGCDDRFRSEIKLLEQSAPCRAGSVVVNADDSAGVTDKVTPTDADAGLDRDSGPNVWWDNRVAIALVLLVEPLPTGHRDDPRSNALVSKLLLGCDGVLHLRAGPDQDHIRGTVAVFEEVAAFGYL
jgi:hypothetical protein